MFPFADGLAALGAAMVLGLATPELLNHTHRNFLGLRLAVGLNMLLGTLGMAIFLIEGHWGAALLIGCLLEALGWAGSGLLIGKLQQRSKLSRKDRRKQRRKAKLTEKPFGAVAGGWVSAYVVFAGALLPLLGGLAAYLAKH